MKRIFMVSMCFENRHRQIYHISCLLIDSISNFVNLPCFIGVLRALTQLYNHSDLKIFFFYSECLFLDSRISANRNAVFFSRSYVDNSGFLWPLAFHLYYFYASKWFVSTFFFGHLPVKQQNCGLNSKTEFILAQTPFLIWNLEHYRYIHSLRNVLYCFIATL